MKELLDRALVFGLLATLWFCAAGLNAQTWSAYGGDAGGSKATQMTQIDRSNVHRLEPVWSYQTGHLERTIRDRGKVTFETTPILFSGRLVLTTPYNEVIALDPGDGRELWRFDSKINADAHFSEVKARGVAGWLDTTATGHCAARIFLGTLDARLIALDAETGRPCAGFGASGTVDLAQGVALKGRPDYQVTSPPAIYGDLVLVGSSIGDNRRYDVELGVVRAFDARTGAVRWSWDPIPRSNADPVARATWIGGPGQTGAANAWSILSVDLERGLVFIPTGSASPDFYGGRRPGANLYSNSVVALAADTGEVQWHFQVVHHDLWDYDVPAQPVLTQMLVAGNPVDVVVQGTKMGFIYVLDRETGKPVFSVDERPVPQGDVDGEWYSPTQPFPQRPPSVTRFERGPEPWGIDAEDLDACGQLLSSLKFEGPFTPPSLQGSLLLPGNGGGINWGGVAAEPTRRVLVTASNRLPTAVWLHPRDRAAAAMRDRKGEFAFQAGTPYAMTRRTPSSPSGLPCTAPPWGVLSAVDLDAGRILWQVPLGTLERGGRVLEGTPTAGGPIVSASGLVFVAATQDRVFRAIDIENGRSLWQHELPAPGHATPMTYLWRGQQYVVIAAGGHGGLGPDLGDSVVAFALAGESRAEGPNPGF